MSLPISNPRFTLRNQPFVCYPSRLLKNLKAAIVSFRETIAAFCYMC